MFQESAVLSMTGIPGYGALPHCSAKGLSGRLGKPSAAKPVFLEIIGFHLTVLFSNLINTAAKRIWGQGAKSLVRGLGFGLSELGQK